METNLEYLPPLELVIVEEFEMLVMDFGRTLLAVLERKDPG
jgi:hypothetical protein